MAKKNESGPELKHTINLTLGDWSHDGHSMTETVTIASNLDKSAILKAYKNGVKKVGLDVTKSVAAEYEDSEILGEDWNKLEVAGLTLERLYDGSEYDVKESVKMLREGALEARLSLWPESFTNAWLFIVEQGDPTFKYEFMDDESPDIHIGGYGLFNN